MSFLYAIIGLCILIVLHELGHFLAARWSGMKVHEFAVGFGPKIFSFRRGDTEFSFRAILLGGYVRIAGMHPAEEDANDPNSFLQSAPWKRFIAILAGPIANYLTAFLIFACLFYFWGIPNHNLKVASVKKGSIAAKAGLKKGDSLLRLGKTSLVGKRSSSLSQQFVKQLVATKKSLLLEIKRQGKTILVPIAWDKKKKLGFQLEEYQSLELHTKHAGELAKLGFQQGDEILTLGKQKLPSLDSLRHHLKGQKQKKKLVWTLQRKTSLVKLETPWFSPSKENLLGFKEKLALRLRKVVTGSLAQSAGLKKHDVIVTVNKKPLLYKPPVYQQQQLKQLLGTCSKHPLKMLVMRGRKKLELTIPKSSVAACQNAFAVKTASRVIVVRVLKNSVASKIGLQIGDQFLAVNGKVTTSVSGVIKEIRKRTFQPLKIKVRRVGKVLTLLAPKSKADGDWRLGFEPMKDISYQQTSFSIASSLALKQTIEWNKKIWQGFAKILSGKEKANLTGPVGLIKRAKQTVQLGFYQFLVFVAIISIHLAFFNLLPIPALDGGRILFLFTQQVIRLVGVKEEVGIKLEAVANMIGFLLLFGLLLMVTFKDIFFT